MLGNPAGMTTRNVVSKLVQGCVSPVSQHVGEIHLLAHRETGPQFFDAAELVLKVLHWCGCWSWSGVGNFHCCGVHCCGCDCEVGVVVVMAKRR